jgi:uncharacterized protein (TIGR02145 family)
MKKVILGFTLTLISVLGFSQTTKAYVAPGDLRTFLDYNLGANTSLSPTTPSMGIKGDKYQWGKNTPVNSSSWGSAFAPDNALSDSGKTANDPCPSGYRIPTSTEWQGVIDNNTVQWIGDFIEDGSNVYNRHGSGLLFNNSLFLPAAGSNYYITGALWSNNAQGAYWSTTASGYANYAKGLTFVKSLLSNNQKLYVSYSMNKNTGANVRCIKEVEVPLFAATLSTKEVLPTQKNYIYPNPVKEEFFVRVNEKAKIEVSDSNGNILINKVISSSSEGISTKEIKEGVYFVKVLEGSKVTLDKIIINK